MAAMPKYAMNRNVACLSCIVTNASHNFRAVRCILCYGTTHNRIQ
jgi:hypothetical protein